MFRMHKNPYTSSFGMGHPNLNPVAKIGIQSVRVGEYHPSMSRGEVKSAVQKSLERAKK
jgi:hypothetical protein